MIKTKSTLNKIINNLNKYSRNISNISNNNNKTNNKSSIQLYSWGSGWSGQLGLGKNILEQYTPERIEFENNVVLKSNDKIKTGSYHALLIKEDSIYSWGQNNFGQLGLNDTVDRYSPVLNNQINNNNNDRINNIKYVNGECGAFHSIVSTYDTSKDQYKTYSFGWNKRIQCGQNNNSEIIKNPTEISFLNNQKIKTISCGFDFSVVVSEDNKLYLFGMNDRGQCSLYNNNNNNSKVLLNDNGVSLIGNIKVKKVSSGWGHTILLSEDGELFSWGSNQHGQCGTGLKNQYSQFSKIQLPNSSLKVLDISCGSCVSAAILSDNNVYIWGSGGDGKLGLGDTRKDDILKPTLLDTLYNQENNGISSISFGSDHCIALPLNNINNNSETKSSFYGWGFGQHGCFGLGYENLNVYSTPIKNNYFNNNNNKNSIISIQSSLDTTFALINKKQDL